MCHVQNISMFQYMCLISNMSSRSVISLHVEQRETNLHTKLMQEVATNSSCTLTSDIHLVMPFPILEIFIKFLKTFSASVNSFCIISKRQGNPVKFHSFETFLRTTLTDADCTCKHKFV